MGQFFQVNGDYNIKTRDGGTITLDTGTDGDVNVVGNLTVGGTVTAVSATELEIADRVITVNKNDTGPGVSTIPLRGAYSGLEVNRGFYPDSSEVPKAAIVWNEENPPAFITDDTEEDPLSGSGYWMLATGSEGSYGFRDSTLKLRRIITDATFPDLIINTGTGVVSVEGTTDYELLVSAYGDDALTNKKYVDDAILNNPTFQISSPGTGLEANTRVIISDADITPGDPGSPEYLYSATSIYSSDASTRESSVTVVVDGDRSGQFYTDRIILQGLIASNQEITSVNNGGNIYIHTQGTGKLQTNYGIQLDNTLATPSIVSGSHVIYSKPEGEGKTGIYYVNTENTRDELISKSRAFLYSVLF